MHKARNMRATRSLRISLARGPRKPRSFPLVLDLRKEPRLASLSNKSHAKIPTEIFPKRYAMWNSQGCQPPYNLEIYKSLPLAVLSFSPKACFRLFCRPSKIREILTHLILFTRVTHHQLARNFDWRKPIYLIRHPRLFQKITWPSYCKMV